MKRKKRLAAAFGALATAVLALAFAPPAYAASECWMMCSSSCYEGPCGLGCVLDCYVDVCAAGSYDSGCDFDE